MKSNDSVCNKIGVSAFLKTCEIKLDGTIR